MGRMVEELLESIPTASFLMLPPLRKTNARQRLLDEFAFDTSINCLIIDHFALVPLLKNPTVDTVIVVQNGASDDGPFERWHLGERIGALSRQLAEKRDYINEWQAVAGSSALNRPVYVSLRNSETQQKHADEEGHFQDRSGPKSVEVSHVGHEVRLRFPPNTPIQQIEMIVARVTSLSNNTATSQ